MSMDGYGLEPKMLLDENSQKQLISVMKCVASTSPEQLCTFFTTNSLVMGIKNVDSLLGARKDIYDSLLTKKYGGANLLSSEKDHINQLLLLTLRELKSLSDLAQHFDVALKNNGCTYEFETRMDDISDIISSQEPNNVNIRK